MTLRYLPEGLSDERIDPRVTVSHRMPLSEAAEGYQMFAEH
jgi:threonine dehydrogenase-like Zn-dependent dehydrogenase